MMMCKTSLLAWLTDSHFAAGLGFSGPVAFSKQTILPGFSLNSNLGQALGLLFFSTCCGNESAVGLGRVMRSGTADRSGFFLSSALGASAALALNAIRMIPKNTNFILPRSPCIEPHAILIQFFNLNKLTPYCDHCFKLKK